MYAYNFDRPFLKYIDSAFKENEVGNKEVISKLCLSQPILSRYEIIGSFIKVILPLLKT